MAILKKLLFALLGLVALGLLVAAFLPKHFEYEHSIDINAPKELVFGIINDLKTQETWGPWGKEDPTIKNTYNEVAAGVGQVSSWTSENSGNGSQTITESTPPSSLKVKLDFEGAGGGDGWFKLEDGENGATKTTWGMSFDSSWPTNLFTALFAGGMMDKMFEQGLTGLKEMAEQKAAEAPAAPASSYEVKPFDFPGATYLGSREQTTQAAVMGPTFFSDRMGKIMKLMQQSKMQPSGSPAGVYYTWDDATKTTDMAVAIPVGKGTAVAGGGLQTFDLPASKALLVELVGPYSGIMGAHLAIGEYVKANGLKEKAPVIEEYTIGPPSEKDSTKWLTKIIYMVEGK